MGSRSRRCAGQGRGLEVAASLTTRETRRLVVAALAAVTLVLLMVASSRGVYQTADDLATGASASRAAIHLTRLLRSPPPLQRAENLITARCLERKGLRYRSPVRAHDPRAPMTLVGRPLSVSFARLHGYGFSWGDVRPAAPSTGTRDEVLRALAPPGARQVRVRLPGEYIATHVRRGCVARARLMIYGSLENYLALVYVPQGIRREVLAYLDAALRRDDVQEAASAYASCMHREGHVADTPRAAWLIAWQLFGDEQAVSMEQRRMAVADARCQARSAIYPAISVGLAQEGRRGLIESHTILSWLMGLRETALTRARDIVLRSTVALERKRAG